MYNGIGLQTPRGSGTSGHIQKNLSSNVRPKQTREQFLKQLQTIRENVLPPPRKANPQIVMHERKRQVYLQTMKLRQKLKQQKLDEEQIQKRIAKAEQILLQKLQKGEIQTGSKDSHLMSEAKQKEYKKLRQAFQMGSDYQPGSAFDFETQQKKRLQKLASKDQKKKFICPHQDCQKSYNIKNQFQRHLKHKHNEKLGKTQTKVQKI